MNINAQNFTNQDFPLYRVDAFTEKHYSGNPAGVCLLDKPLSDATMQQIATELNLSETAFVHLPDLHQLTSEAPLNLRWFTPKVEVKLCGHATLATAAVLFRDCEIQDSPLTFTTLSGELIANEDDGLLTLNFPSDVVHETTVPRKLMKAIGHVPIKEALISEKSRNLILRLPEENAVKAVQPAFRKLDQVMDQLQLNGLIVTSRGSPPFDFVSRFFAPTLGIDEDPVTGAAHTILGPYWSTILNKTQLQAFQASRRGGVIHITVTSDDRVLLAGDAVIFFKGKIYLNGYSGSSATLSVQD